VLNAHRCEFNKVFLFKQAAVCLAQQLCRLLDLQDVPNRRCKDLASSWKHECVDWPAPTPWRCTPQCCGKAIHDIHDAWNRQPLLSVGRLVAVLASKCKHANVLAAHLI